MKRFTKFLTTALAASAFACIPALTSGNLIPAQRETAVANAATSYFTTTPTGFTQASDVNYSKYTVSGKIANWGARGENCTFLSQKALSFYTNKNTYADFAQLEGNSNQNSVPDSALYNALQEFMIDNHKTKTSYNGTKSLYKYTDCISGGYNDYVSSFYSGTHIGPDWGEGGSWNREHTWPKSKGIGDGTDAANDIMMLRPTATSENGDRGNTAYGQSSGYYDPNGNGANLRGDCARIVLYMYVRWESHSTTTSMWGSSGVMESKKVLLQWMKEDPVDTWEMGRNDAVQSITGTRNVFVDYPELAFKLFNEPIPSQMSTPSQIASGGAVVTPPAGGDNGDNGSDDTGGDSGGEQTPTLPAAGSTVSIADAAAIGASMSHNTFTSDKYYITGKITDISNTQYGNMTIEDEDGNSIYVYGTYSADGNTRYDALTTKPVVGDTITLYSVIGNYNGAQLKSGWITAHNGSGNTGDNTGGNETPDDNTGGGNTGGNTGGEVLPGNALARFEFGDNGSASHVDGNAVNSAKTYTDNGYSLTVDGGVQLYDGARDGKGNSCLKLGSSKNTGSFSFSVPSDVTSVTLLVAKYKSNASKVTINGQTYTISGASDAGEYDEITVDTSTTKKVSVSTVSGGTRVMINTILFNGAQEITPDNPTPDEPTPDNPTPDEPTPDVPNPDVPNPDEPTPETPTPETSTGNGAETSSDILSCSSTIGGGAIVGAMLCAALLLKKKKEN